MQSRIYFSVEDNASSIIQVQNENKAPFPSAILNISEDGMLILIDKQKKGTIKKSDRIDIKSILFPEDAAELNNLEGEVLYVLEDDKIDTVSISCRFTQISNDDISKLRKYIEKTYANFEVL